jgi:hypothetical protein
MYREAAVVYYKLLCRHFCGAQARTRASVEAVTILVEFRTWYPCVRKFRGFTSGDSIVLIHNIRSHNRATLQRRRASTPSDTGGEPL